MADRRIDADDVVAVYDRLFRQPTRVAFTREGTGGTGGTGDGGPGAVVVEEGGTVVVATATSLRFDADDFDVSDLGGGRALIATPTPPTARRYAYYLEPGMTQPEWIVYDGHLVEVET